VQEREVQSLDAVLAFSTDDNFSVGADYRDANALGHAIAVNAQLRLSDASEVVPRLRIGNMDSLSLRLRAPRPLRLPFDVETTAFYQFLDYPVFRSRLAGGSAALLRTLIERSDCAACPQLQGRLAYELTQGYLHIKGDATDVVLPHSAPRNLPSATIARLVPSLSLDGRDQALDPHRGYAATSRFEVGIPRLAGPLHHEAASFWRILLATQGYLPLGRPTVARLESGKVLGGDLLLATSLTYSVAGPLGAHGRVPDSETFYYGGDFSVRGLSTRASQAARLATAMLTASMELRFYLYELGFGTFALAGFVDLGSVAQRTKDLLQETTVTAGPVLRYVTFVGPISLGYGWPLHRAAALLSRPDLAPPHGRLHFTFGYSF
jgi:outer membrane protein assembly factor BamA